MPSVKNADHSQTSSGNTATASAFARTSVPADATNDFDEFQHENAPFRFDIYRLERVSMTSIFFSGGDWHWTLRAPSGTVLVESAAYRSETECRAAITALRQGAASATVSKSHADEKPAAWTRGR